MKALLKRTINGIPIKKVLINTSSNVNICTVDLLQNFFSSIYANMKRIIISIKGFDNTKWDYIGYVTMPIEIGGKIVDQKFYIF